VLNLTAQILSRFHPTEKPTNVKPAVQPKPQWIPPADKAKPHPSPQNTVPDRGITSLSNVLMFSSLDEETSDYFDTAANQPTDGHTYGDDRVSFRRLGTVSPITPTTVAVKSPLLSPTIPAAAPRRNLPPIPPRTPRTQGK
jgi:hypothetical protein